jgi:hypothetical protein
VFLPVSMTVIARRVASVSGNSDNNVELTNSYNRADYNNYNRVA